MAFRNCSFSWILLVSIMTVCESRPGIVDTVFEVVGEVGKNPITGLTDIATGVHLGLQDILSSSGQEFLLPLHILMDPRHNTIDYPGPVVATKKVPSQEQKPPPPMTTTTTAAPILPARQVNQPQPPFQLPGAFGLGGLLLKGLFFGRNDEQIVALL